MSNTGNHPIQPLAQSQMTPVNVPMPDAFDFSNVDAWPKWIRRFERFSVASGLCNRSARDQVCTLIYAMGDQAEDVLNTLHVAEQPTFDDVKQALDNYFGVRRNLIIERAKFNRRVQKPGESVDVFIQDLYRLSDNCQYGTLRDELIRDRIVVAVLDEALSDRMQTQATLTLDQAVQLSRQSEARKQQRDVIRGDTASKANIDFVRKAKPRVQSRPLADARCKWCGRQPHSRQQCPAKEAKCNNCNRIGHFRLVCRSVKPNEKSDAKHVHKVDAQNIEDVFLGEVRNNSDNSWSVNLTVDSYKVNFKLDTGAAVSVLSDTEPLLHRYTLCDTSQRLRGAGGTLLPVLGTVRANLGYNGKTCTETLYVITNQQHSLLGRDACHKLDLIIVNVNEVQNEFPKLFHGLGKLQTKHHITLTNNAQPVCVRTTEGATPSSPEGRR